MCVVAAVLGKVTQYSVGPSCCIAGDAHKISFRKSDKFIPIYHSLMRIQYMNNRRWHCWLCTCAFACDHACIRGTERGKSVRLNKIDCQIKKEEAEHWEKPRRKEEKEGRKDELKFSRGLDWCRVKTAAVRRQRRGSDGWQRRLNYTQHTTERKYNTK